MLKIKVKDRGELERAVGAIKALGGAISEKGIQSESTRYLFIWDERVERYFKNFEGREVTLDELEAMARRLSAELMAPLIPIGAYPGLTKREWFIGMALACGDAQKAVSLADEAIRLTIIT